MEASLRLLPSLISRCAFRSLLRQTDHLFPYILGHCYEFRVTTAQEVDRAARSRNMNERAFDCSTTTLPAGLEVMFSLISAYSESERLSNADAGRLALPPFEPSSRFHSRPTPRVRRMATSKSHLTYPDRLAADGHHKHPRCPSRSANLSNRSRFVNIAGAISLPARPGLMEEWTIRRPRKEYATKSCCRH